ncbi:hypothetical protein OH786_01405 [Streptomyces atratus]|uniref:hypothetical protein n=1 Tax=Streptomyces atratus TaxID=1893 RepID=UPI0015A684C5|nr:hypothetical protein [Streptomyces atratus]
MFGQPALGVGHGDENLGGDFFSPAAGGDDWLDTLAVVPKEQLAADGLCAAGAVIHPARCGEEVH